MRMQPWYMPILFAVKASLGCAVSTGGGERVDMFYTSIPQYQRETDISQGWRTLIVFQGESPDDWTEASEMYELRKDSFPETPRAMLDSGLSSLEEFGDLDLHVLQEDESSVVFEGTAPERHVIGKILYGNIRVWVVTLTAKGVDLSDDRRSSWIRLISAAQVRP